MSAQIIIFIVAAIIASGLTGYGMARAWHAAQNLERRITHIEEEVKQLKDRRRHPNPTADGLEDALAICLDVLQEYDASRQYTQARMRQVGDVLKIVRNDPHGYREEPNQKKPYGKR
jgi:hypothetical protein